MGAGMKRGIGLFAAGTLLAFILFARFCSGPRPRVVEARVRGNRAEIVLRNDSSGEGDVQVEVRARPRGGGPPLVQTRTTSLRGNDVARVEIPLEGARGDESLEVKVDYPPR